MSGTGLEPQMEALLQSASFEPPYNHEVLHGGRNNRLLGIQAANGQVAIKQYYRHAGDSRARLASDFAFASFAWDHGIRCVPRPLGVAYDDGIALYEFITGIQPAPEDVTKRRVEEALSFYLSLNANSDSKQARELPEASEACFSLDTHINRVSFRLDRLRKIPTGAALEDDVLTLISNEISPKWNAAVAIVRDGHARSGADPGEALNVHDRCISPSDFGYHNALISTDGTMRFFDFEYAGWDDPAKMTSDFFCQPDVPVPLCFFSDFVERTAGETREPDMTRRRMELLLPVYQVKWTCIVLNEFLPMHADRRMFSTHGLDLEQRKARQFEKAKRAIARLHVLSNEIVITSPDGEVRID